MSVSTGKRCRSSVAGFTAPVVHVSAFILLSLLGVCTAWSKPVVTDPKVSLVEGEVTRRAVETPEWTDALVGDRLEGGDNLKTGTRSRSEVEFASGRMRLYQNSLLVVPDISVDEEEVRDIRHVEVQDGSGIFNIFRRGRKEGFTFGTRHIIGGVKGTIFSVMTGTDRTEVAVMQGVVEVADRKNPNIKVLLRKGQKVTFWADMGFGDTQEDEKTDTEEMPSEGSGGFGPRENFQDLNEWDDWKDSYDLELEDERSFEDFFEKKIFGIEPGGGGENGWVDPCPPENDKSNPLSR